MMQPGIHNTEPFEPLWHHGRLRKTDRPTPILTNQGNVLQIQRPNEAAQNFGVPSNRVPMDIRRFIGPSKAEMIRRNAAITRSDQRRNHVSVKVTPGRHSMHEQHDRPVPWPFIQVVQP